VPLHSLDSYHVDLDIQAQTSLDLPHSSGAETKTSPWPRRQQRRLDCRYWPWTPARVLIQIGSNANAVLPSLWLFLLLFLLLTWPGFPIWHEVSATATTKGEHESLEMTSLQPCSTIAVATQTGSESREPKNTSQHNSSKEAAFLQLSLFRLHAAGRP